MALNSDLIKRITRTTTSDVMHSSGFAGAQNTNSFGASASTSFTERQNLESNRQVVQGYRRSMVAHQINAAQHAKTYQEQMAEDAKRAATMRAKQDAEKSTLDYRRQEFGVRREAGGLSDTQREHIRSAYASGASARQQSTQNINRQELSRRFDATARPAPKTGGFGRYQH